MAGAYERGPSWRALLNQGIAAAIGIGRDWLLKVIDSRRSAIAEIDLTFNNPPPHYDFSRDVVTFVGQALGSSVNCEISREALDDHFGTDGLDQKGRTEAFLKDRSRIELMARAKYLSWPIEEPGAVLIKTMDVPELLKGIAAARPTPSQPLPAKATTKKKASSTKKTAKKAKVRRLKK